MATNEHATINTYAKKLYLTKKNVCSSICQENCRAIIFFKQVH